MYDLKQRIRQARVQRVAEATGVPYETLRRFVASDQERLRDDTQWAALEDWAAPSAERSRDYWRGFFDAAAAHADLAARLMARVSAAGGLAGGRAEAGDDTPAPAEPPPQGRGPAARRRQASESAREPRGDEEEAGA